MKWRVEFIREELLRDNKRMIVLGIGEVGQQQIKKSKVVLAGIAGLGFISFYNLATKA